MPDQQFNSGLMYDAPDYLKAQRAQMIAEALGQYSMTPTAPVNPGMQASRVSPLSVFARVLAGKMSGNALKTAGQEYGQVYGNMQGAGNQAIQDATQGPFADRMRAANFAARYGLTTPEVTKGLVDQAQAENKPSDIDAMLRGAGIMPGTPEYKDLSARLANKQAITDLRPGNVAALAPNATGAAPTPLYAAPGANGVQTTFQNGQASQSNLPGSTAAQAEASAAVKKGTTSEDLIKLGTDTQGRDIYVKGSSITGQPVLPSTPPGSYTGPKKSFFMNPAQKQAQTSGAEAGQTFSTELAREAKGATDARRSIAEIVNLSQKASPSVLNASKLTLGGLLIAAGNDPATVSKRLGTDIDSLTAASKQVGTLAVSSIHSMTSRGTNFDLSTFMRQNPNLDMASPGGLQRVSQWLDSKFKDSVTMQKEFNDYRQAHKDTPEDWESDFTSQWLDKQNKAIEAGQKNSQSAGTHPLSIQALLDKYK